MCCIANINLDDNLHPNIEGSPVCLFDTDIKQGQGNQCQTPGGKFEELT